MKNLQNTLAILSKMEYNINKKIVEQAYKMA